MKHPWRERPFGAFATLQRGADLPVQDRKPGRYPILASNGPVGLHELYFCQGPGVVTGRSGTIGKPTYIGGPFWPLNTVLYVSDFHGNNPRFVYFFFQFFDFQQYATGATVPTLNRNFVHPIVIRVPPKPEQERIAAILWKIQRAIEVEDKLVATARELKQSAMRQLFTHGLRGEKQKETEIGHIPESWDIRLLENLREFLQYGTSAKCGYAKKGNPVIRIPNVIDGKLDCADLKWCELSNKEIDSLALASGDLLFIRTNGVRERVGTCGIYTGEPERALFASYLIRARLRTEELNPHFLQYFTDTTAGLSQLGGRASPAADGKFNVNTKTIDSVLVPVPEPAEQREIVRVLQTIDRKISVHERKRAALSDLFQTLLHQLMTAQIRVDKLNIDTSEVTAK